MSPSGGRSPADGYAPDPAERAVRTYEVGTALLVVLERLAPELATTAYLKEERGGKVFVDSTRSGQGTVVAAYSPRIRPGLPVSAPVPWESVDRTRPEAVTVTTARDLLGDADVWAAALPEPQELPADVVAEGHTIPIARVQAMHEGKRRKRAEREAAGEG